MADDIRALTAALARDPSSLLYVDLAEALRRRGQLPEAHQAVLHGLSRNPEHADGYDCLARIHSDRGELAEARAAWERALVIHPEHPGALRGLAFLFFRQGDVRRAADTLEHALAANPLDDMARRALAMVRGEPLPAMPPAPPAPGPEPAPRKLTTVDVPQLRVTAGVPAFEIQPEAKVAGGTVGTEGTEGPKRPTSARSVEAMDPAAAPAARPPVFVGLEGATQDILLLDPHGLVLAGGVADGDGADVSELAAAALAGVSGEATRTAGYLDLGIWGAIVAEAEHANLVLAPVGDGALLMVRRERSVPVGLTLRIAERARGTAARWLEGQAG